MRKLLIATAIAALAAGCGHNLGLVGIGTGWRVGNGEYGFAYGDGIFGTFITKDGVKFRAELDSTTGFSYDPSTNTYKGIKSFEYSLPPQITGYAVDFAKNNPEVAKAYYKALLRYFSAERGAKAQTPLVSDGKSKEATSGIADVLKAALGAVKGKGGADSEPFVCDGDCELTDLAKDNTISHQTAVAAKLLTYADDTTKFDGEVTTLKHSLESFIERMEKLVAKGKTTTCMRVKYARIKDGKLADLNYVMIEDDGSEFETHCPECVLLED